VSTSNGTATAREYWLSTWPDHPVAVTRANGADAYPAPLTPLSQDLVLHYEDLAIRRLYVETLGVLKDADVRDPFFFAVWGLVYLNADNMAMLGKAMPGTTPQALFQQFFGLEPDPNFVPPARSLGERVGEAAAGIQVLPRILRLAKTLPGEIALQQRRVRGARPDGSLDSLEETQLLAWLRRLDALQVDAWHTLIWGATIGSAFYEVVRGLLTRWLGPDGGRLANSVHAGLGGNESAEAARAVRELAALARGRNLLPALEASDPVAAASTDPVFADALGAVIDRFGHRGRAELELANASWRADPRQLLDVVAVEAHREGEPPQDRATEMRVAAEAELEQLPMWRRKLLAPPLRRSQAVLAERENGKIPIVQLWDELRRLLTVGGPLLQKRGVLADAQHIFYLRHQELHEVLQGGTGPGPDEVGRRVEEHARCLRLDLPELIEIGPGGLRPLGDDYVRGLGLLPSAALTANATTLTGIAASAGVVTARARVLTDSYDDFEAGDILIAHTVDPGWAPILNCAGAVVLDVGGLMSHGAMVARELGIPCVVNVKHGTQLFRDGQTVTVDGAKGFVRLN
jgi:pyruvate,water dikinase